MFVAAKSQAAQSPGQPVIVPNDPPNFNKCIAQARKDFPSLAKASVKTLRADCKQLFTSLSSQVMDFLIKAYWYQADASKLHVKVTDAEVQKAFTTARNQQFPNGKGFDNFLSQTGQTTQDILFRFRINTIVQKLVAKHKSTVTQADIQKYYSTHSSQFGTQESRNVRVVLASSQANALAAKKALSSGQSWAAVAKKYSTDSGTKNSGGLLTGLTKRQADPALAAAAFSAPTGKLLGPVKGQFGYYIYEVLKVTPGTHQTLAQATPLIRQQLTSQQQQGAQSAVDNHAKKDWLRQTTCRSQYAMADCKGYKAPKKATTGSSTG
jgi:foldase protein PrsA